MHTALTQGVIDKNINNIPIRIFSRTMKLLLELTIPTEKIITGILKRSTIILPSEKFFLFNKFIEDEIEPMHDKIKEPIKKLMSNEVIFSIFRFIKILARGIEIKNGIYTKIKCDIIFRKDISS